MIDDLGCAAAEAALLGALMATGDPDLLALDLLQVDDFGDPRHRSILTAIRALETAGAPPDPITVLGRLRADGTARSFTADRSVGAALADMVSGCPFPSNARFYARVVLEHAARRRAQRAACQLAQAAGVMALADLAKLVADELAAVAAAMQRAADPTDKPCRLQAITGGDP
jgi:replicative DNA helicase